MSIVSPPSSNGWNIPLSWRVRVILRSFEYQNNNFWSKNQQQKLISIVFNILISSKALCSSVPVPYLDLVGRNPKNWLATCTCIFTTMGVRRSNSVFLLFRVCFLDGQACELLPPRDRLHQAGEILQQAAVPSHALKVQINKKYPWNCD